MPRSDWLRHREQRLATGTLEELLKDLALCRSRERLASMKSHLKSWRQRRLEIEEAITDRFGEEILKTP
jgi:hypothetical protein